MARKTAVDRLFGAITITGRWVESEPPAIGIPQFGHAAALSEICLPHSLQLISAIGTLPSSTRKASHIDRGHRFALHGTRDFGACSVQTMSFPARPNVMLRGAAPKPDLSHSPQTASGAASRWSSELAYDFIF